MSAFSLATGVVGAVAAASWAVGDLQSPGGGAMMALLAAIIGGVAMASRLPAAVQRWRYLHAQAREGRRCYAVTEDELFVTDDGGRALLVELDRIVELVLDGDELRLRVDDSEAQGVVYAVLFGCFDEDGPSAGSCFDALASQLRARRSGARIESSVADGS